ncbi:MAG: hypothetical protein HQL01_12615 [Nitrospirae bacterium]|nr:hypothetical protein [Nitrospirota bacterium]
MDYLVYGSIAPSPVRYENRAEGKILLYSTYPEGWFYGQGSPPSDTVVKQAIGLLHTAQVYSLFVDSALGVEGEIQLVVYHDNDRYQFTIAGNNGIEFLHERKNKLSDAFLPDGAIEEICCEDGITFDGAMTKINHLGRAAWNNTFGLSNQKNRYYVPLMKKGSAASHSGIRQMGRGYPAYPLVAS